MFTPVNRISLQKCREILGDACDLSDAELELLRDELYGLADTAICEFVQQQHRKTDVTGQPLGPARYGVDDQDWIIIGSIDLKGIAA